MPFTRHVDPINKYTYSKQAPCWPCFTELDTDAFTANFESRYTNKSDNCRPGEVFSFRSVPGRILIRQVAAAKQLLFQKVHFVYCDTSVIKSQPASW